MAIKIGEQRFGHRDKKYGTEEYKGFAIKIANLQGEITAAQSKNEKWRKNIFRIFQ